MKRLMMIAALLLMVVGITFAQEKTINKITPDLQEELIRGNANEMFRVIIIMNEQFDAHKSSKQIQQLDKMHQREFVVNELQQLSQRTQKEVLKDLHQGQKAAIVDDINPFWIINAISCTTNKNMVYAIAERPDVKLVVKDLEIRIPEEETNIEGQPNLSQNQWNVTKVHAPEVWNLGFTGRGVVVAVLDTGINYNHTDISDNMWDGGSDYPYHGWDFINNDNNPMDDHGHGTHCAGTVSSYGTSGKQCGIAKEAKIMALKVLDSEGHGNSSITIPAIEFAVSHGADILSMSLGSNNGGFWPYRVTMDNVLHCGIIASVSAGNKGEDLSTYPIPINVGAPGNCPSPWRHPDQTLDGGRSAVIAVGATTSNDTHSSFSSYGPSTWAEGEDIGFYNDYPFTEGDPVNIGLIKPDISAPGSGIVSLQYSSNNGYSTKSGTSMAAPCVAGIMALMLQANPTLTPMEIDSIIETTAVKIESQTSKNNTVGSGRIDALAIINHMLNACAAPTNLSAIVNRSNVALSWSEAENVASYRVYRNGVMIAEAVTENTYTDHNAPAGNSTYYVRSNGENQEASLPSNQVTVNITTNTGIPSPDNFNATEFNSNDDSVTLNWEAPSTRNETLCYTTSISGYTGDGGEFIAAQKFPSSMIRPYAGMQIEHLLFSIQNSGSTCSINLYEGDEMLPGNLIFEGSYTTTEAAQQVDYILNAPVVINPNKDLWLTITTTDKVAYDNSYESPNGFAFLFQAPVNSFWNSNLNIAWAFQIGLSDSDYTYNLYQDGTAIASEIATTSYTAPIHQGLNNYCVTAITNEFESLPTNILSVVNGEYQAPSLSLNSNDKLIVLSNSKLIVSGSLNNTTADNLVIENGAQLIHNSDNVKATVKKHIDPYTADNNGWYFIASPVAETITPSKWNGFLNGEIGEGNNTYDLYYYNEPDYLWKNYENEAFNIEHKKGYLYANGETGGTTLQFEGTLTPSNNNDTISNLSHSAEMLNGFNLVGNPFACNAIIDKDCYVIEGSRVVLASGSKVFAPCEGAFVKADSDGYKVAFSKYTEAKSGRKTNGLDFIVAQGKSILDRARIRLGEGTNMEKISLEDNDGTQLSLRKDGQDYAVVYAEGQTEMPVNFKTTQNGIYTLSIENLDLDLDYLHLIDNLTGTDTDLLSTPSYRFETKTTDYTSRFKVVFNQNDQNGSSTGSEAFAYVSGGNIIVNGEGTLQIIDATGRIIVCKDGAHTISTERVPAGIYVLRLIDNGTVKTQKIVIE